jgi:putative ABC transport system permease protein
VSEWIRLGVGLAVLLATALVVARIGGIGRERDLLVAAVRAVVQLSFIALVLRGVFAAPALSAVVVTVMFLVAAWTAAGRLGRGPGVLRAVVLACGAGATVAIVVIVGLPTLDRTVRNLVAVSGIVIGGTMTGATLAGRHLNESLRRRRDEVEAWLSLGATPRQAVRDLARWSAAEALLPGLDQTRTVGLVTLPGAYIGALLGGASAAGAARFQVVVLVGLLCAQTVTVVVLMQLLGAPARLPPAEGHAATGRG